MKIFYSDYSKEKYNDNQDWKISMVVIDKEFRAIIVHVKDCCWQCESFTRSFVYPAKGGNFELDTFFNFCREYCKKVFPRNPKATKGFIDSFDILDKPPDKIFFENLAVKLRT